MLFDQERALLPATQPLVEHEIRRENLHKSVKVLEDQIFELRKQQTIFHANYRENERILGDPYTRATVTTYAPVFVRGCPDGECRGFLSTQWKCGVCEKWSCHICHEVKGLHRDIEHECNPDNVATAALLSRDTKPCPNCRSGIFKIDGCDQMWCTQCHTAFSWRTGRIENTVHNPHYFEWIRRNGGAVPRNPQDVVGGGHCGVQEVTHHTATEISAIFRRIINGNTSYLENLSSITSDIKTIVDHVRGTNQYILRICERVIHIRLVELPQYRVNHETNNQVMRVRYMRNQITEEEFKINLQRQYLSNQKKIEMSNILQMVHDTCSDIILRFKAESILREWKYSINTLSEMDGIIEYANSCLCKFSKIYASKQKFLTSTLSWGIANPTFPSLLPIPITNPVIVPVPIFHAISGLHF